MLSIYDKAKAYDVFCASEVSAWEKLWTAQNSSFGLMQQAALMLGEAVLDIIHMVSLTRPKILVCCGMGNNGGDGYLVANTLMQRGYDVDVFAPEAPKTAESLAAMQSGILQALDVLPSDEYDIYIDALFGNGLNKDLSPKYQAIIHQLNHKRGLKIAIDIPSGLHPDKGVALPCAFVADFTLSVMGLRLGFFVGRGREFTGEVLHLPLIPKTVPSVATIDTRLPHFVQPDIYAHKSTHGHALIIGGHQTMGGAVMMAGETALASGAGKVTIMCHKTHHQAILSRCPALMVRDIDELAGFDELLHSVNSVAFGMGLGRDDWSQKCYQAILPSLYRWGKTVVLDADALYFLAKQQQRLQDTWIATPHTGEAARLLGGDADDRLQSIRQLQQIYGGNWLLKGANSLLLDTKTMTQKGVEICAFGNASMATAGMGDVLSGTIAGLKSRFGDRVSLMDCINVHALAGDKLGGQGQRRIVAQDMAKAVQQTLDELTF